MSYNFKTRRDAKRTADVVRLVEQRLKSGGLNGPGNRGPTIQWYQCKTTTDVNLGPTYPDPPSDKYVIKLLDQRHDESNINPEVIAEKVIDQLPRVAWAIDEEYIAENQRCQAANIFGQWVVRPIQRQKFVGKLTAALAQGASANVDVWTKNKAGTPVATGETVIGHDWFLEAGEQVSAGKNVFGELIDGTYWILGAQCEEGGGQYTETGEDLALPGGTGFQTYVLV